VRTKLTTPADAAAAASDARVYTCSPVVIGTGDRLLRHVRRE